MPHGVEVLVLRYDTGAALTCAQYEEAFKEVAERGVLRELCL